MVDQLGLHGGVVGHRVGAVQRGQVDHVHQQPAALDVGQELVPQPGAVAGALDQPRDVGHHQLALVGLDRAQHGVDGGERVVGHLRPRGGQAAQERALAGVGQPHQPGVGQQAQAQVELALLAGQAALGHPRASGGWRRRTACCRDPRRRPGPRPRAGRPRPGPSARRARCPRRRCRAARAPPACRRPRRGAASPRRGRPGARGSARRGGTRPGRAWTGRTPAPRRRRGRRRHRRARPWARGPHGGTRRRRRRPRRRSRESWRGRGTRHKTRRVGRTRPPGPGAASRRCC